MVYSKHGRLLIIKRVPICKTVRNKAVFKSFSPTFKQKIFPIFLGPLNYTYIGLGRRLVSLLSPLKI